MEKEISRKADRRAIYTHSVIKDALLELLAQQSFDKISVASLCRQAQITRSTFYLHYTDLTAVVNELVDEALEISNREQELDTDKRLHNLQFLASVAHAGILHQYSHLFPACQRIADNEKFIPLFQDELLAGYVIKRIYQTERTKSIPMYMSYCHLTEQEANLIFLYHIYGAFYMNRALNWKKDDMWFQMHDFINRSTLAAMEAIRKRR